MENEIDGLEYLSHELMTLEINVRELQEHYANDLLKLEGLEKIEKLLARALYIHDKWLSNTDFLGG